jgi:UDP-N-acetyl-D-mannosaminuronate dehydrogenase
VPTPVHETKEPDMFFVESAARTAGQNLKKNAIIVLESTVYPGVMEEIVKPILEKESGINIRHMLIPSREDNRDIVFHSFMNSSTDRPA